MKLIIFDGARNIGGNKIYVEEKEGIFLDFGINFSKHSQYFEEFLRERVGRGIHDLFYLGLIPKLNVYRKDLIPADLDVCHPKLKAKAVLISHAHLDHCGCAGLLREDVAVVASPLTLAMLKALRDLNARPGFEAVYISPRSRIGDGRYLKSCNKYLAREVVCTSKHSSNFVDFVGKRYGDEIGAKIYTLSEFPLPFEVKACEVDHSTYGANAYLIYADTTIAYTGDFRLHGKNAESTKMFVRKARDASVLIVEGTRVSREDYNVSEEEVQRNCLKAVEESKGLVIANFSQKNFERLEMFAEIARKTGRKVVVSAKQAYLLHALEIEGVKVMKDLLIYDELKLKSRWEKEVVMEKWEEKYVDPRQIAKEQENYVLCFSFYDMKHLLDIKPKGGTYIYSASEAFSEEEEFDFLRLNNWLERFNFKVYGFKVCKLEKPRLEFVRGYHASGHASKKDLEWVIDKIDPDLIIPVHTDNAEWFLRFENAKILEDGESLELG